MWRAVERKGLRWSLRSRKHLLIEPKRRSSFRTMRPTGLAIFELPAGLSSLWRAPAKSVRTIGKQRKPKSTHLENGQRTLLGFCPRTLYSVFLEPGKVLVPMPNEASTILLYTIADGCA